MKARFAARASMVAAATALVWGCAHSGAGPQTVKVSVTDRGFVPAEIQVHRGQPVTLLVTRTTDQTCAKEIVIPDANVRHDLPLNREVRITFTPAKPGELRYTCGMGMISGAVRVE